MNRLATGLAQRAAVTRHHRRAAALLHTSRATASKAHGQPMHEGIGNGDDVGVEPEVSRYALGATAMFVGGLTYYIYSEYKHRIPWLSGAHSTADDASAEAADSARKSRRRMQRSERMPVSTMQPSEQVNWAWTHPGLYVTGSNAYGLVDPSCPGAKPGSGSGYRASLLALQGKVLRSAVFSGTHAAALDAQGCLYQWGTGFTGSTEPHQPVCTLKDSSARQLAASRDCVLVLDSKSRVRLVPGTMSQQQQQQQPAYLTFSPSLGWRENAISISAGAEHVAVTTDKGNVYTAALGERGSARSQTGHSDADAPAPFVLKRLPTDHKYRAAACGAEHTLLLTDEGNVLGCGANDFGQLAMGPYAPALATIATPTPLRALWKPASFAPSEARADLIAAGAATSYIQVRRANDQAVRLLACGRGIDGQLGNGTLVHMQGTPTPVPLLSDKREYSQQARAVVPLGVRSLSACGDHAVAVRDNGTNVVLDRSGASVDQRPAFGYDVLVWGSNKAGQCVPGRKHRLAEPTHPLMLFRTKGRDANADADADADANSQRSDDGADDSGAPGVWPQAAPRQWVKASSFANAGLGNGGGSTGAAKHLVEQAFVAGPEVTAAYLKLC
ncbi:hypothetical protein GGI07_004827 [Coemansia sp. Benny D115]|nr:hypothetical protein GGI07_004827 [Coemansia sp. Benny D115]